MGTDLIPTNAETLVRHV